MPSESLNMTQACGRNGESYSVIIDYLVKVYLFMSCVTRAPVTVVIVIHYVAHCVSEIIQGVKQGHLGAHCTSLCFFVIVNLTYTCGKVSFSEDTRTRDKPDLNYRNLQVLGNSALLRRTWLPWEQQLPCCALPSSSCVFYGESWPRPSFSVLMKSYSCSYCATVEIYFTKRLGSTGWCIGA
jgi:hypothetical protein